MDFNSTLHSFNALVGSRQGGGLFFNQNATYPLGDVTYVTGVKQPPGYKPFKVSILKPDTNFEYISLILSVNPKDINIGQNIISSTSMTRKGWIPTIWGPQQITISCSGITSAFIMNTMGLTNFSRKNSISFINFQSLVGIFKNNGYHFLTEKSEQTFYNDGYSRVIDVMDVVGVSYDETDYVGSFSSFTIEDDPASPYRLSYNFEFVVSGFKGDQIDGHVNSSRYSTGGKISIEQQGKLVGFKNIVKLDVSELNRDFQNVDQAADTHIEDLLSEQSKGNVDSQTAADPNKPFLSNKLPKKNFNDLTSSQQQAVRDTATKAGVDPNFLVSMFTFESGGTLDPKVQCLTSTGTGIFQAIDSTAVSLGYPGGSSEFGKLTFEQQCSAYITYLKNSHMGNGQTTWDYLQTGNLTEQQKEIALSANQLGPGYVLNAVQHPNDPFPSKVVAANPGTPTPNAYLNQVKGYQKSLAKQQSLQTQTSVNTSSSSTSTNK